MARMNYRFVFLTIFAAIVIFQVFVPPVVANSNNGDFGKITGSWSLGVADPYVGRFSHIKYVFDPSFYYTSGFRSSESLLLRAALGLNRLVSKTGDFDIRFIGAIHSLILLVTFWLFLPLVAGMRPLFRNVLLGFVTLAYTDVMYISYLNSFYMDTAGMLFGLAAIVFFLRSVLCRSVYDRWLLLASLTLMVTSKTQHYPLGVILTAFHLWKGNLLATQRWFGPLAAAILGAATAVSVGSAPADYAALGGYTVVFNQILPDSPHIEADMEDLRLRPSDRQFIGTHAYQDEAGLRDPVFKERYLKDTPYWRLGWFLLAHPQQAIQVASARLSEAGRQRPRRGNFDPSAGLPPSTESKAFAIWSGTKARNLEGHGGRYLAWSLLLAATALALTAARRRTLPLGIASGLALLCALYLVELTIATFADALDAPRHFLLFDVFCDTLLIATVFLTATLLQKINAPRTKPGRV